MKIHALKIALLFVFGLLLFATPANAQLTFTLESNTLTLEQNAIGSFSATVLNETGGAVDLSELSLSIDSPLTTDATPFLNNFPFTINNGESFTGVLFGVTVPLSAPIDTYSGLVSINGPDGAVTEILPFTVNVRATTAPEPASLALALLGGMGLCLVRIKR